MEELISSDEGAISESDFDNEPITHENSLEEITESSPFNPDSQPSHSSSSSSSSSNSPSPSSSTILSLPSPSQILTSPPILVSTNELNTQPNSDLIFKQTITVEKTKQEQEQEQEPPRHLEDIDCSFEAQILFQLQYLPTHPKESYPNGFILFFPSLFIIFGTFF
mgnify:CR=1 FL=1